MKLSLIIPIGPGDESWKELRLEDFPCGVEVVFSVVEGFNAIRSAGELCPKRWSHLSLRWIEGSPGRAAQLNRAIAESTGDALWIVHADTRWIENPFPFLESALQESASSFWFFPLRFYGGDLRMGINTLGVRFRSEFQKIPYGDQAFLVSRETANHLGPFDEKARYGEDHLWVWRAHQLAVELRAMPVPVWTSARRYVKQGWLKTTLLFTLLQWKQGLPQWWRARTQSFHRSTTEAVR